MNLDLIPKLKHTHSNNFFLISRTLCYRRGRHGDANRRKNNDRYEQS